MTVLRLHALSQHLPLPATAVTIGNFDGVHLGHQAMLHVLKDQAKAHGLSTLVLLFEPQPLEYFKGTEAPPRISSFREKVELIASVGIDYIVVARFDATFRSLTAMQFADLLKHQLNAHTLVLGDDFRFGCDRRGDSQFLSDYGFDITHLPTLEIDGQRVSSTRVRDCLMQGQFAQAKRLLGRDYSISGRVQYGDQIGRTIDFPTINVALNRLTPCLHGIYAVDVTTTPPLYELIQQQGGQVGLAGLQPNSGLGAAHVGTRPAIHQAKPTWRLEVNLPQAQVNLYGQRVTVTFWQFIHGELNYPSLEALKAGIAHDVIEICNLRQAIDLSLDDCGNKIND